MRTIIGLAGSLLEQIYYMILGNVEYSVPAMVYSLKKFCILSFGEDLV